MAADIITVSLHNAGIFARIGVFKQERIVGNEFRVDVDVSYPAPQKVDDSDFDALISYADIYDLVKENMSEPSLLLETKAQQISFALKKRWPKIIGGSVCITKTTPPIPSFTGSASVQYKF